mmetsp:Transcript_9005/g.21456  ORF Transcript_9005/g.21456 Transcript_9005/m.21456 type:complete len:406 (+) Transcript_9005:45-1262(+)
MGSALQGCTNVSLDSGYDEQSEVQLNAFEFRNYRTALEADQQRLLEQIVNHWAAKLVKGKKLDVNGEERVVSLDKDLLVIRDIGGHGHDYCLAHMDRMVFRHEEENSDCPWVVNLSFTEDADGNEPQEGGFDVSFKESRVRLNFALTLRILRARDPQLDLSDDQFVMQIDRTADRHLTRQYKDSAAKEELLRAVHFNADKGFPIIFSVSDLKLTEKLQSTSWHCYLEFFVKYPSQDKFLYAKSPAAAIPNEAMQTDDFRKAKAKEGDGGEDEERWHQERRERGMTDTPVGSIRFELKNVKLKVPKIPHTLFGRLMAKDEYFPTALGTFQVPVEKKIMVDKRVQATQKGQEKGREAEIMRREVISAWKMPVERQDPRTQEWLEREELIRIGTLTIRALGYITDPSD